MSSPVFVVACTELWPPAGAAPGFAAGTAACIHPAGREAASGRMAVPKSPGVGEGEKPAILGRWAAPVPGTSVEPPGARWLPGLPASGVVLA